MPLEQRQEEYPEMFRVVGELKVPYILMSVQPTLATMMKGFAREVQQLRDLGAKDIILDPGFCFGNYINSVTGRNMLLWNGGCHVHEKFSVEAIIKLKQEHPEAVSPSPCRRKPPACAFPCDACRYVPP